ncbi:DUF6470 family protein [Lentibacillus cibarius]|uniref:YviE n=1 Tax=Lentibacillus cibarius TaxID=2583219 RepID=A0A5S3QHH8_9BACI|nr:DUF6470 family protein [Lentibacillus cibarius]TMN21354.1 hypothetical protein FFL34_03955 [Lentibacillus cibarius]
MQMLQIRMESQPAKIHIQTSPPIQKIHQSQAEMSIRQPKADLSITTTPSKLTIDQTKAWEDMNLMSLSKWMEKFADEGRKGAMEGTARRVRQGAELMTIEHDGNPIARQASGNAFDEMKRIGITFVPSPFAVKLNYRPSKVQIDARANEPMINAEPQKVIHQYTPGDVAITMQQHQDLQIDFVR